MQIESKFKQLLSKMLFLEFKKHSVEKIFNTTINTEETIYIPLESSYVIENINNKYKLDNIPLNYIVESMFLVLGADSEFKYNEVYKKLLSSNDETLLYIKKRIADFVKEEEYEKAYVLIKGLILIEQSEDYYEKAILLLESLRIKDKCFRDEEFEMINKLKSIKDYDFPYLYETLIYKDDENFYAAYVSLNEYFNKGGEQSEELLYLKSFLNNSINYEKGKELVFKDPKGALEFLVPLTEVYENNALLFYHIAVSYRILGIHEKAIYYLNLSIDKDNNIVEVVNELGINYASLGNYDKSIEYFKKAFEVTKSIEICTNLIMSCINSGKSKDAKKYLEVAKKIKPEDDIVIQLEKIIRNDK